MMRNGLLQKITSSVDWTLFSAVLLLVGAGLITMQAFIPSAEGGFFERQIIWALLGILVFFGASLIDWRFLRRTSTVVILFGASVVVLLLLFLFGTVTLGAVSRFDIGVFFIQPTDLVKLVLIIVLAKYFSRRHVEIADWRHIIVSGVYAGILFVLVFLQPDFGGALVLGFIWLGMVLASGISKKHLLFVLVLTLLIFAVLWGFVFAPYQKARIITFLDPFADIQGAGYNAYQSTVTVGSGQLIGKGVGYGTQSRLQFLPEYETDFIFAAFAEEWGFVGSLLLFILFGVVVWRIVRQSMYGQTNFETLFGIGVALFVGAHFLIHIGMNIGLLPVTGITLPFVSYGGSHLIAEFLALGMLAGMRTYSRATHRHALESEFVGPR